MVASADILESIRYLSTRDSPPCKRWHVRIDYRATPNVCWEAWLSRRLNGARLRARLTRAGRLLAVLVACLYVLNTCCCARESCLAGAAAIAVFHVEHCGD